KRVQQDDRGSDTEETIARGDPGRLARTSTAVFVDRSRAIDLVGVRVLAAATVGFDARRGDRLAVQAVDFHREREPIHDGWWLLYGAIVPLLPALALAAGAIAVARIAAGPMVAALGTAFERASLVRRSQAVAGYTPASVRGALVNEPPHAAAAIISALPAATAAAVLELYPQHERDAIVRRMQRPNSPLIPDADEVLSRHA
ncbi:MAG: flagellar M-ring protein FliF C-terminal domain-containing protein, partial [Vulcanimicrobiaceae bacterium]